MENGYNIKKIKSAPIVGEYKSTSVDKIKSEVQLLLKSSDPKIVHTRIALSGVGIKKSSNTETYQVSNSAWDKLKTQYSWMTDF